MAEMQYLHGNSIMIPHTPSGAAVSAGQVVELQAGVFAAIAHNAIADGARGDLSVMGVYRGTADGAIAVGDVVYWDDAANKVTKTSTTNPKLGRAITATTADGQKIDVAVLTMV